MTDVRLGAATAWSRDRFGPATDLARRGRLDYLCFESMSELTMSEAQMKKSTSPDKPSYDPYLEARLAPVLRDCHQNGTRIISNQGWLDPPGAAERVAGIARSEGINGARVAAVSGGDLTSRIADMGLRFEEDGEEVAAYRDRIVSAEAYLGAEGIVTALADSATVVLTARVADACLYMGPLAYEFGWSFDDHEALAQGMILGHLMECAGQVTGGYFADPGYKDVPDLANLGHPIAEVGDAGWYITKLPETGGLVSTETCKEQLLYEVGDPSGYLCPDTTVDFTSVRFAQAGENRVQVIGGSGRPRPDTLKVLVGLREGYAAEEMVLFAGPGAVARAELARTVLLERFERTAVSAEDLRVDYVGLNSVHRELSPAPAAEPYEVVLRVAARCAERADAEKLRREVDPMAVNGPAATGKWAPMGNRVRPVIGLRSVLVPRDEVDWSVTYVDA
ncbi:MAG: acyclic terpene utilization AtuA family protein [Streptosporangiales bacterium]